MPDALARLEARLSALAEAPVELARPNDPEHGDYATSVAMRLAPVRRRSPREIGDELAAAAAGLEEVERAEVAGPGFVNLWLAPAWFGEALAEILETSAAYGGGSAQPREKVRQAFYKMYLARADKQVSEPAVRMARLFECRLVFLHALYPAGDGEREEAARARCERGAASRRRCSPGRRS